jgi:hypothetical protein
MIVGNPSPLDNEFGPGTLENMVNPFVSQWIVKQYISKENWIHVLEEELQYIYFEFF